MRILGGRTGLHPISKTTGTAGSPPVKSKSGIRVGIRGPADPRGTSGREFTELRGTRKGRGDSIAMIEGFLTKDGAPPFPQVSY